MEKIARKLKLTGFVENLKPYDVRIIAEGEQDALDEFITHIRIEKHPIIPISVEELDVEFKAASREFEYLCGGYQLFRRSYSRPEPIFYIIDTYTSSQRYFQ